MPTWIHFKLIEKPYYDANGNLLESINGMKNRKGVDEFIGGGKVYPCLKSLNVIEKYEAGDNLLVCIDEDASAVESGDVTYKASHKIYMKVIGGFQKREISEEEATVIKETVFNIKPQPIGMESGVTK